MTPESRVAAVIVHFRTPEETVRAAAAVAEHAPGAEILVVDNDSRDGIASRLAERVPSARAVEELVNRGYGAACNRGARETSRPLLLFLNSDAYLCPGALDALVRALEADQGAAAAGPRLIHLDGRAHYVHSGWFLISVANLVVVIAMIVVFVLAIVIPFPGAARGVGGTPQALA